MEKKSAPRVVAVCISERKGMRKKDYGSGLLIANLGLDHDAHADSKTHRQISLLALESIQKMQDMGLDVHEGDFAENITTQGINLLKIPVGSKIRIGTETLLEISQHGKVCHSPCAIYHQAGTCVMPKEGVFAKVLTGGTIKTGDRIITESIDG